MAQQVRGTYGNRHINSPFRKPLIVGLWGMVSLLVFAPTLLAAPDSKEATTLLQKAMIDTAKTDPNRLVNYQERIADIFCEAAEKGLETELIEAFTSMWTTLREDKLASNPQFAGFSPTSRHTVRSAALHILDRYITKLQELEADSGRSIQMYDSLQSLVLPPNEKQTVVIGWQENAGGQNGFYRTFVDYLVQRAIAEKRLDDLKAAVKHRREQITDLQEDSEDFSDAEKQWLKESAFKCDVIDMQIALRQGDLKQVAELKKRFSDAIKKNELADAKAGHWTILAMAPAYDNGDLFPQVKDLVQEAVTSLDAANQLPRYYYQLMPQILPMALKHSSLSHSAELAEIYRKFSEKQLPCEEKFLNHPQFAANIQLYDKAMATDSPAELLAVIDYFGKFPANHARRPNLLPLLDRFESLTGKLSESDRKKLLGDTDLAAIRTVETSRTIPTPRGPLEADRAGLPELPSGKSCFSDNFNQTPNSAWSSDRRDISANGKSIFLGGFCQDKLQLRLSDLPPHKLVRMRFDLLIPGAPDGLVGYYPTEKETNYGPDYWELYTNDNLRLIATTFSNFDNDPYSQKQSYPDDFSVAFGVEPSWYDAFLGTNGESLWGSDLSMGYRPGRAGATAVRSLGVSRSATYAIDLVFPHDDKTLELNFRDDFRDGRYARNMLSANIDENWALDNVRIELVDEFWNATPEELDKCFDSLVSDNPITANAARWRLVAAGDKTVEHLEKYSQTDKGKKLSKATASFVRFRIERILDIIGSDRAKELRKKWFGPELAWKNENLPNDFWPSENQKKTYPIRNQSKRADLNSPQKLVFIQRAAC